MRNITVLKEGWRFGKSRDTAREAISLPHTWNAVDGQDGGNDYYRGTCWYARELSAADAAGERAFLELNGAAHTCALWMRRTTFSCFSTSRRSGTGCLRC